MNCPQCDNEMGERVDYTYSNVNTDRCKVGQHTGDIYKCEQCGICWLDSFLDNRELRECHG